MGALKSTIAPYANRSRVTNPASFAIFDSNTPRSHKQIVPSVERPLLIGFTCFTTFEPFTRTKLLLDYLSALKVDQLIRISQDNRFQCTQCSYSSRIKSNINRHVRNVHFEPAMVSCNICGKTLKNSQNLTAHLKKVHTLLQNTML